MTPWERREQAKRIGGTGRKSEVATAKRLGGDLTPGSGAINCKADMTCDSFKIEAKSTVSATMALALDWLLKVRKEAYMVGLLPSLTVTFTDARGQPRKGGRWVLMEEDTFKELMESEKTDDNL